MKTKKIPKAAYTQKLLKAGNTVDAPIRNAKMSVN